MSTAPTFDLTGAVKATNVPVSRATLPIFEAVANAIDAIEAHGNPGRIEVRVERENSLFRDGTDKGRSLSPVTGYTVVDDGEGFTDANVESFMSLFTTAKEKKGGKGIGRVTWFRTFDSVKIVSHYLVEGEVKARRWEYKSGDRVLRPWAPAEPVQGHTGTEVRLQGLLREYEQHPRTPKKSETLAVRIVEHFLARFAHGTLPKLFIVDGDDVFDALGMAERLVKDRHEDENIEVDGGHLLSVRYLMLGHHSDLPGRIVYCAGGRAVEEENPSEVVPDVSEFFAEPGGGLLSLRAYVSGPLLERANNPFRTSFNLDEGGSKQSRMFTDLPTRAEIRDAIRPGVEAFVSKHIAGARAQRNSQLERHLEDAPWYRGLVVARPEVRERIPVNARDEALEMALYRESIEWRSEVHQKGARLVEELKTEGTDFEAVRERLWEQQESLRSGEIDDLARYVTHRRAVLLWLENYLKYVSGTEAHVFEAVAHDLFFRRKADSKSWAGSYYNHNLWILDDQLAFHRYTVSDKPFSEHAGVGAEGDDRPDVCVYSRCVVTERAEDDLECRSVTIVEFKKPGREVYGTKDDPIIQVKNYAHRISLSTVRDDEGRTIQVGPGTRYYGYVIVDPADKIEEFCGNHDMKRMANGWGWLKDFHNTTPRISIEVLSFDKVLKMAERRNRALFNLLGLKGEPPK